MAKGTKCWGRLQEEESLCMRMYEWEHKLIQSFIENIMKFPQKTRKRIATFVTCIFVQLFISVLEEPMKSWEQWVPLGLFLNIFISICQLHKGISLWFFLYMHIMYFDQIHPLCYSLFYPFPPFSNFNRFVLFSYMTINISIIISLITLSFLHP
jgi:hypothetical protein